MTVCKVMAGAKSPESIAVSVRSGLSDLNMNDVVSAYLSLKPSDGGVALRWPLTLSNRHVSRLIGRYTFADTGRDVPRPKVFTATVVLVLSAGERRTHTFTLAIVDRL